jgi:hypothetical protein
MTMTKTCPHGTLHLRVRAMAVPTSSTPAYTDMKIRSLIDARYARQMPFPALWRRRLAMTLVAVAALSGFVSEGRPELSSSGRQASQPERPNILWITSEDNGPQIGAYGDTYATTPNLDALANKGFRYRVAWSNGPVCGASRTALITGVYPESTGGEHMRSSVRLPAHLKMYPTLLREAGYYVTNNAKTDYNYPEAGPVWDESSAKGALQEPTGGQAVLRDLQHHDDA